MRTEKELQISWEKPQVELGEGKTLPRPGQARRKQPPATSDRQYLPVWTTLFDAS